MMSRGKAKGNEFERKFCKQLSLWFSNEVAEDWFWRSQSSGGRATQRTKKIKTTQGQYGDVCATSVNGEALTNLLCIELKKGYNKYSLGDLLDSSRGVPVYSKWITKIVETSDFKNYKWIQR